MVKNPISVAKEIKTNLIYESNFSTNTNNWNLYVQPSATANFVLRENAANIEIKKASTDGWHVQFVKNDIPLKKGRRYLVRFEAKADADISITNYLGQASGNYSAYSGYKGFTVTKTESNFTYSFVMNSADDPKARIVFDLGLKTGNVYFKNIKIEEVQGDESILISTSNEKRTSVFPNPVMEELNLNEISGFHKAIIYDQLGRKIIQKDISNLKSTKLDTKSLPQGVYYLYLLGSKEPESYKLIKN